MRKNWTFYTKNTLIYFIFLSLVTVSLSFLPSIKTSHIRFFAFLQENYYFREEFHTGCFSTYKFVFWLISTLSGFAYVNLSTMHNSRGGIFKSINDYRDIKIFIPLTAFVYFLGPILFISDIHDNNADCHLPSFSEQIFDRFNQLFVLDW